MVKLLVVFALLYDGKQFGNRRKGHPFNMKKFIFVHEKAHIFK